MSLNRKIIAAAVAACGTLGAGSGQAAVVIFDNTAGTGEWTTPTNWNTDTVPTIGDLGVVDGGRTVTYNGGSNTSSEVLIGSVAGLVGNPGGAGTLNVQTGTLGAQDGNVFFGYGSTGTLNVANGATFQHTGAGGVIYAGFGVSGNGVINVAAGGNLASSTDLFVGFGSAAQGAVTVNGTLTNGRVLYQGVDGGNNSVTVAGAGVINNLNSQYFVGHSGVAGSLSTLTVQDTGAVNVGDILTVGRASNGIVNQTGGTVTIAATSAGLRLAENAGVAGTYSLNGGTLVTPGISAGAGIAVFNLGGELRANNSFASSVAMTLTAGRAAVVNTDNHNVTLSGNIGGATTGFTKLGVGTLVLSGTNTYTGPTTVGGGILRLGSAAALGANPTGAITLGNADTSDAGSLDVNGQSITLATAANIVLQRPGSTLFNSSATASSIAPGVAIFTSGAGVGGSGDLNLNGAVTDFGTPGRDFTKVGTGTVRVNNQFTFVNQANVLEGTLLINGAATAFAFNVSSGATLGGTNTITSNVVAAGAVAPGDAAGTIGTLTTDGAVDLNGLFAIDLDGSGAGSSDRLAVSGLLDIAGSSLDLNVLSSLNDAAYVIATYGSLTGSSFANVLDLPAGYSIDYGFNGNSIAVVQAAAVPEPTSIAALVSLAGVAGLRRRQRRACAC